MGDLVKEILVKPIQYADEVVKLADGAISFRQDCLEVKAKTEKLVGLLRQAARASGDLYERPTRRIIDDTEQVLDKALTLVLKCRASGIRRIFTIIPAAAFRKISQQLENSIGDVSWLLRVSTPADARDDDYLGLPPIAANEPILCLIWEQIAVLCSGAVEERTDAAASLVSLARDNDRYGKLIIEEGGLGPLLKLAKEGKAEGQENVARAIGLLGKDPESVEQIVNAGVCQVFAKILKEGHMKVQVVVAWAVSEMAANHRKCQDHFLQNNTIQLLVSHLAFETIPEHHKYAIAKRKHTSIHHVLAANSESAAADVTPAAADDSLKTQISHPMGGFAAPTQMHNIATNAMAMKDTITQIGGATTTTTSTTTSAPSPPSSGHRKSSGKQNSKKKHRQHHQQHHHRHHALSGDSIKGRELEDPATKAEMKIMAARALRYLCAGNVAVCRSITESRALLCFSVLLEKGAEDVRYHSAMALMEITAVAEKEEILRRSAFKPTALAAKAVVDQFLIVIQKEDPDLLIPSIQSIGNLARTFRASDTRFIGPLVGLLDDREPEITCEAAVALGKFSGPGNFLNIVHSKSIINDGGIKFLVPLVYFGEQMVQIPSFILLCYLAMNVPDSEVLAKEDVLIVIEWATKQSNLMQDKDLEALAYEGKKRLELYQSRASKGYY
ncbi:uncharacterized protein LOC127253098 isoform X1 [Andrographis paniculata]|uniref:uncharacterized protein LOC127253098 isoform X1 n=1 Tax=Andrographis paniculata TaxID=175694 RepID=UPI0021E71D63|nr:uncharacterized protein LOC127253098 isoform X1 [Andrographis paniculata]